MVQFHSISRQSGGRGNELAEDLIETRKMPQLPRMYEDTFSGLRFDLARGPVFRFA